MSHPLYDPIVEQVKTVLDPDIGISIYELGLIYKIDIQEGNKVKIDMTLTSMACPAGPYLQEEVTKAAKRVDGVEEVEVEIVWTPPWNVHEMASEEARYDMGIF